MVVGRIAGGRVEKWSEGEALLVVDARGFVVENTVRRGMEWAVVGVERKWEELAVVGSIAVVGNLERRRREHHMTVRESVDSIAVAADDRFGLAVVSTEFVVVDEAAGQCREIEVVRICRSFADWEVLEMGTMLYLTAR